MLHYEPFVENLPIMVQTFKFELEKQLQSYNRKTQNQTMWSKHMNEIL